MNWRFWKTPEGERGEAVQARKEAEFAVVRARKSASDLRVSTNKSVALRESNGFAEDLYDLMFPGRERG